MKTTKIHYKNLDLNKIIEAGGIQHIHIYHDPGCPASEQMGGNGTGCTCESVDVEAVTEKQHLARLIKSRTERRAAERAALKAVRKAMNK